MRRLRDEAVTAPALTDICILHNFLEKEKSLLRKNSPKAQGVKRNKPSRPQGSELPSGRNTQEAAAARAIPEVGADVETPRIEDADEDTDAVRVHR